MNTVLIGILSFVVLLILVFLHMPISIVMVVVGTIGYALVVNPQAALIKLGTDTFNNAAVYTLSVIPMFLLMGLFLGTSGLARRLFDAFNAWFGHIRGGLAIATVGASAFFSAVSGSNIGTAATIGKVAVPEMRTHKYKDSLAAGCVAAGGTLGILIPPSSLMIVYGALTEESIGKLLIAGILPGIVTAVLLAFTAWLQVRINPSLAPTGTEAPFKIKMQTLKSIWPVPVIFAISMGGIWLGVFTATEGGAIGAFLSLLYALITKQLTKKGLNSALEETANVTAMIFLVIIGGTLYGHFLTATRIPLLMKEYIIALDLSPLLLIGLVFIVYFVAGFVMDAMAIIVIFTNLFYPLVTQAGYNGIWFGVITILLCNIGFITPPVGPVSMVTASATNTPVEAVFKGVTPFWFALIAATAILIAFPNIATYLPGMMMN
ncbi:MAG TPA: TRAP transporter large permease [Firmicutes bacterium]|jgi:tripartite ATP-independent transporter DctM subunit|nr:TRAP transporter large permease [Bacillota bacterium]